MKIRTLALALALTCSAANMVQAAGQKKPMVQKPLVRKMKRFKPKKYKQAKVNQVKPRKPAKRQHI